MPDAPCPLCRRSFTRHFAVRARCAARWRGRSFDAAQAQANVGLALADALGVSAQDKEAVNRFAREVVVQAFREAADLNPAEPFDPRAEGEWWEFHVGFVADVPDALLARGAEASVAAVAAARNFSDATILSR